MTQEQNTATVTLSMENVKELFREIFKGQEQALPKILSSYADTLNQTNTKMADGKRQKSCL